MSLQSATYVLRSASLKKGKKGTSDTFHPRFRTDYVSTTALEVQKLQPSTILLLKMSEMYLEISNDYEQVGSLIFELLIFLK